MLILTASDPFDSHFSILDEGETTKKLQAAEQNKWSNLKKELPESLKLVRAVPDVGNASLLPAMKDMTNVKVRPYDIAETPLTIPSLRRNWLAL